MSDIRPNYYQTSASLNKVVEVDVTNAINEINFDVGNIYKYLIRHNHKNGDEDLKKAITYIHLQEEYNQKISWEDRANARVKLILKSFTDEEKAKLDYNGLALAFFLFCVECSDSLSAMHKPRIVKLYRDLVVSQISKLLDVGSDINPPYHQDFNSFYLLEKDDELVKAVLQDMGEIIRFNKLEESCYKELGLYFSEATGELCYEPETE